MHRARLVVKDERGIAVVLALVALMTLSALVLAFLAVSTWEPQISRNLADSTRARYVAEAGLETAYDTLITNVNWNGLLAGATCTTGAIMGAADTAMPGLTAASGTYTVRVRNDCNGAADAAMTGVLAEGAGNAENDTNDHVILVSQGRFGTAMRQITVVVTRVPNLLCVTCAPPRGKINAALSFPGYEADTRFTGNSFEVDGRDRDANGVLTGGQAMLGISVGPEDQYVPAGGPVMQHELQVQNSLTQQQKDNVAGRIQTNPSATTTGDNTIAADAALTSQNVIDFVNAVKYYADVTINSTPQNPASFNNIGNTCPGGVIPTPPPVGCWGTPTDPKIVYVKGTMDPTSAFTALNIAGSSTGSGILIVEDGDFTMRGNFHWEGPIFVTGGYVGVGIMGGGNQDVLGALISNETAANEAPGFYEGVLQGNAKVRYSKATIDRALALLGRKVPGGTGNGPYVRVTMYNFQESQ